MKATIKPNKVLIIAYVMVGLFACKKDYVCKGTDSVGERTYNCSNCTKKDKDDYAKSMEEAGWKNVTCEEK